MERRFLCTLVLLPRGQSAPDMALGLVLLQHRLHLRVERAVVQRQALGQILMYRGLADTELFRGGADGGPVFYEVKGQLLGPLFQILSDRAPLPYTFAAGLFLCRLCRHYSTRPRERASVPRWPQPAEPKPRARRRTTAPTTGRTHAPGRHAPARPTRATAREPRPPAPGRGAQAGQSAAGEARGAARSPEGAGPGPTPPRRSGARARTRSPSRSAAGARPRQPRRQARAQPEPRARGRRARRSGRAPARPRRAKRGWSRAKPQPAATRSGERERSRKQQGRGARQGPHTFEVPSAAQRARDNGGGAGALSPRDRRQPCRHRQQKKRGRSPPQPSHGYQISPRSA